VPATLIAGFGNELRGDDGFGVEVIHQLEAAAPLGDEVRLLEVGTGGLSLAQALLTPYDCLIIVDAMTRGGTPGTLYVLEVEGVESAAGIDLHLAIPARALSAAQALGALPGRIYMVGCEPLEVDDLVMGLSGPVRAAVSPAIRRIRELVAIKQSAAEVIGYE